MLIRMIRSGAVSVSLMMTAQGAAQAPLHQQTDQATTLRPIAVTQLDERQHGSDLDSTRPLTITLAQAIPITDLLLMLVRDTRLSVVPEPDVQGMFRGDLKDVTLRQALEMILQPHGLDYALQGNLIRVFRRRLETRRFDLNAVLTRPTDAGDMFTDLSTGVQTLLSPEGRFSIDRKAALLQATDHPDRLDQIQQYLDAVHNRTTRQVQIQAKVIEVALNDEFSAGINWHLLIKEAGDAVRVTQHLAPAAGSTVTVGLNVTDFDGLLLAFASQGKVNVLASPTVTALNNEPAVMRVVTHGVFFKTTTRSDAATGGTLQKTAEPQAFTEGVVLSVTPQIAGDGLINMGIAPSLTERTGQATSRFGDTAPILKVREADTIVRVRENETVVIAGLLDERVQHDVRKVPVLGGLPGIGAMFRGETTSRHKSDLVILLTPTVMTPARATRSMAHELERVSTR